MRIDSGYVEKYKEKLTQEAMSILANKRFQNGLFLYELNYRYILDLFESALLAIDELIGLIDKEIKS